MHNPVAGCVDGKLSPRIKKARLLTWPLELSWPGGLPQFSSRASEYSHSCWYSAVFMRYAMFRSALLCLASLWFSTDLAKGRHTAAGRKAS